MEEDFPEFFVSHYKAILADRLIDEINKFMTEFTSENEQKWMDFISKEEQNLKFFSEPTAYKSKDLSIDVIKAALHLLVVLPIKADVKHDWHVLETKIARIQKAWEISPIIRCYWHITDQDMQIRV